MDDCLGRFGEAAHPRQPQTEPTPPPPPSGGSSLIKAGVIFHHL